MSEPQTIDKATANGKQMASDAITKSKKQRKTCGVPTLQALSSMNVLHYSAHIEKEPTPWDRIENYEFYSPSADGSRLMQKIHRSKSLDIKTQKTLPTIYGQAYRVFLEANPSKPDF